jgi:cellobiose dehydrogenase (acceptor)
MAGCVLGGGTAVNAGLWWRANPKDFDENFPAGWQAQDLEPAIARVFDKIPFTDRPSMDGQLYKPFGYEILGGALTAAGYSNVTADDVPAEKDKTYSHPNHMFSHGERGGPMATYLVDASKLNNFKLMLNTIVNRVIRNGSSATGVEVQAFLPGGQCGTINLTPGTGKLILSAGAFGTPKILLRSGIGPQDQLEIVAKAEGNKMVDSSQWLNLPVGYNLDDHTNTDITITHPGVDFYDFYAAYDTPILADKTKYLDARSGILAQSAPNLAIVFWEEIKGADGVVRQMQYTARVESSHGVSSNKSMTISQYLGRGKISKGRTTITAGLNMVVSTLPYINDDNDLAAIKTGLQNLISSLSINRDISVVYPAANTTLDAFLAAYPVTTSARSANHWMGSCKMGLDSGLRNGTAVVDTNTKVYGMDNLFVVDASIFPGMVSTNPSALIVAMAEHAAEKIMALNTTMTSPARNSTSGISPPFGNGTATSVGGVAPTGTAPVLPVGTVTFGRGPTSVSVSSKIAVATTSASLSISSTMIAPTTSSAIYGNGPVSIPTQSTGGVVLPTTSTASPSAGGTVGVYQRCGGIGYTGSTQCDSGLTCKQWNLYYFQCVAQ